MALTSLARCPSLRLFVSAWSHTSKPAAAGLLLWARRQEISIVLLHGRGSAAAAGECGQCHIVSVRRKLNTDLLVLVRSADCPQLCCCFISNIKNEFASSSVRRHIKVIRVITCISSPGGPQLYAQGVRIVSTRGTAEVYETSHYRLPGLRLYSYTCADGYGPLPAQLIQVRPYNN